jgi:hypothetical protein
VKHTILQQPACDVIRACDVIIRQHGSNCCAVVDNEQLT